MLKRIHKIIRNIVMFVLVMLLGTQGVIINGTATESENSENNIKTSINELLNVDQYLFLDTDKPYVDSAISYLINADTGQVLYNDDADYPWEVYSVSKVLSAYVILDEMKMNPEKYNWETTIVAEGRPVLVSYEYTFSNLTLWEGYEYTLRELFESLMIKSSNSATMLIGQYMFGSEKAFVEAIRKKVQDLNLKNTTIYTSTGLSKADLLYYGYDDLEDGENLMTAEDVAFLTKSIIETYPQILEISSMPIATFGTLTGEPYEYTATNWLLPGYEYGYEGVDGFKTGAALSEYTSNVVFTAEIDDVRLIGVILGARNSDIRSENAIQLLDYGYKYVQHKTFVSTKSLLFGDGTVDLKYAAKNKISVAVSEDFVLSTSYEKLDPTFIFVPTNSKYDEKHDAFLGEIKAGEVLGYITVNYKDLSFITDTTEEQYSVEVIATEDIGKGFFLFHGFEWIGDRIKEIFS